MQAPGEDKTEGLKPASVLKSSKKEKRLEDWKEKFLHGQYFRQTQEVRDNQCWDLLQIEDLKKATESFTVAAQDQSIRTNLVKD